MPTDIESVLNAINQSDGQGDGQEAQPAQPSQFSQYLDPARVAPQEIGVPPMQMRSGTKTGDSQGYSVSRSGVTDAGLKKATGLFDQKDQQANADYGAYAADQRAGNERLQGDYAKQADAVKQQADLDKQHFDNTVDLYKDHQDFLDKSAALIQQIHADGEKVKAQYMSDYQQQLAGVRQLAAMGGNPLAGLSGGQAAGMAMAQFAQGFLAARGIHIDVNGQIDKWIDRSLQEHQQRVQNARQGAEDTLHLWDIARQTSNDQVEAQMKYRGMVIEGFKSATEMEAARFNSSLAGARAQETIAKLDAEQTKNSLDLGERLKNSYVQFHTMRFNEAHQIALAAKEDRKIAEQERHDRAVEAAAKNKDNNSAKAAGLYFSDPEPATDKNGKPLVDGQGRRVMVNRWKMKENLPQSAIEPLLKAGNEAKENYANVYDATKELARSYEAAAKTKANLEASGAGWGGFGTAAKLGGAKLDWEAAARADSSGVIDKYLRDRNNWSMMKTYSDSGKATNETEQTRHDNLVALDKVLQRGSRGDMLIGAAMEDSRKKFERHMENAGYELTDPNDPNYRTLSETASPHTAAADALADPTNEDTHGAPVRSALGHEEEAVGKLGHSGREGRSLDEALQERESSPQTDASATWKQLGGGDKQPEHTKHVESLVLAVVDPAKFRATHGGDGEVSNDDDDLRAEAIASLKRVAALKDPATSNYAFKLLTLAEHAPDSVKELLER